MAVIVCLIRNTTSIDAINWRRRQHRLLLVDQCLHLHPLRLGWRRGRLRQLQLDQFWAHKRGDDLAQFWLDLDSDLGYSHFCLARRQQLDQLIHEVTPIWAAVYPSGHVGE